MKKISLLFMIISVLLSLVPSASAQEADQITTSNANQLTQLMRLGRGKPIDVAYSPDASMIAVASTVGIWLYSADALDTPQEPPLLITEEPVDSVAFSPDGATLVSGGDDGLHFWDVASQAQTAIVTDVSRSGHYVTFSPDGSVIATSSSNWNSIALIDASSRAVITVLEGHTSGVRGVAFNPDGTLLISGAEDNSVRLWDVAAGIEVANLAGHTSYIYDVSFSPDGSMAATASGDKSIMLWDIAAQTTVNTFIIPDSSDRAYSLAFSPDGRRIAAGYASSKIRVWNVDGSGEPTLLETQAMGDITSIHFDPAGDKMLVLGTNEKVQLWDVASQTVSATTVGHTDTMKNVAFSPDSSTLMLGNTDDWLWFWDTAERPELHLSPVATDALGAIADNTTSTAFAPDGSIAASADGFDIKLWDPKTGINMGVLEGSGLSDSLAFSPDSTLLVYVGTDGVFVFNVATRTLISHLTDHTDWVTTVAFSPDQSLIATGASDGTVRVWGLP